MGKSERRMLFELRPEFLGPTLGIVWAFVVLLITLVAVSNDGPLAEGILTDFFRAIYPGYNVTIPGAILGLLWGFIHGFLLGFLIAWIYRLLVTLNEESLILPGLGDDDNAIGVFLREGRGEHPYTIVFVANPVILQYKESDDDPDEYEPDPIMNDKKFFSITVRRSLQVFRSNELLGLQDIFSSIRFVAIFDSSFNFENISQNGKDNAALCEEYSVDEILAPRKRKFDKGTGQYFDRVRDYVAPFVPDMKKSGEYRDDIDVIYVVSGSKTHVRSASYFSWEIVPKVAETNNGQPFKLMFRKHSQGFHNPFDNKIHRYFADFPGLVALSARDDRPKTTVHEFAHAMGSEENGFIDDEYYDTSQLGKPFRVNKKTRTPYMFTAASLTQLRPELDDVRTELTHIGLTPIDPPAIITALNGIINERETGDSDFLYKVMDIPVPPPDGIEHYGHLILKYADQTEYRVTQQSLIDLEIDLVRLDEETTPADITLILTQLDTLAAPFAGRAALRAALITLLDGGGDPDNTDKYEDLIYKHTKVGADAIPKYFTDYEFNAELRTYLSDRSRPNAERNWSSYAPGKDSPLVSCTMDRVFYLHRYDKLIFDFMYDRLLTKLNR